VGQSAAAGGAPLPGTVAELDQIQKHAGQISFTRLEAAHATSTSVLSAMAHHSWVHLACHASQATGDPTKSAFQLHDGALDLATITSDSLKCAELAFLSACETATGDEKLPDEAIHLAAGMIMAGYPTVIATLWSIKDEDAPTVADKFYEHLLEGGVPNSWKAARALHNAVASLREKVGVKAFARWVPYIHIGR
jgi:CHAT domain-containing protein